MASGDSPDDHTRSPITKRCSQNQLDFGWWGECLVVWGMLLTWSFLRIPIPGVNEPHYLTKAWHLWSPEWCANDFFLNSSNPHLVFYATFGWLTKILTLHDTAIAGRCIGLLVLGLGWQALVRTVLNTRWSSVTTLTIFLLCHSLGNWSGEWLVGGIESKVLAYGFLFSAIACFLNRRFLSAGLFAGTAFSFHPVVGAWGVIAGVMATNMQFLSCPKDFRLIRKEDWKNILFAGFCFFIAALPGLVPALQTLNSGDPEAAAKADLLQVASRLKHHLDPMTFPIADHRFFGILIFLWACLLFVKSFLQSRATASTAVVETSQRWWNAFVCASLIIAACGVLLAWGPRPMQEMTGYEWRIRLLKLYPFRLADLIVPIALSMLLASILLIPKKWPWQKFTVSSVCFSIYLLSIFLPRPDQNPGRMTQVIQNDWREVCEWIKSNSLPDSVVYGINEQWALRWYAARAEYVNYKDCPQDAQGMVEWNNRLWVIHRWKRSCFEDGLVSERELADLHKKTGIHYFITSRFGPIEARPAHANKTFQVYDLTAFKTDELED